MLSMTGYGKAEYTGEGISLTVEIKTVNNRNFDLNARVPRAFFALEDKVRKAVRSHIERGKADLYINFSDTRRAASGVNINEERAQAVFSAAKELALLLGAENDMTVSQILRFPDVVEENACSDVSEFEEPLINAVNAACENLNLMRRQEGEKLSSDMLSRMEEIERLVLKIKERAPLVAAEYKDKLKARIEEALSGVNYEEDRLLSEVAFFTDRANIDEELTRLFSHIAQFRSIAGSGGAGSGKKLDFLMQEFNREANTVCSKSNDITVTNLALSLKNEIEKVREQVQNIE